MTKTKTGGQRLAWTTPQLRRIEAGSAEAVKGSGIPDGATSGNDKS
jgi:hypothetical protein